MNSKILSAVLLLPFLTGCEGFFKTTSVPEAVAKKLPAERHLAYQEAIPGYSKLVIIRDEGLLGSGCYIGIEIERQLAARIDPGEAATFFVPPGKVEVSIVGDPKGRGLCSITWEPVREKYDLKPDQPNVFRLSSRQYRRPELEPM